MDTIVELARNAIAKRIALKPYTLIVNLYPTKDNGYGKQIPDYSQQPVATELGPVSISRRRIPDELLEGTRTPYTYSDMYYMLAPHDIVGLKKGLEFNYAGEKFRTNIPEPKIFGAEEDVAYYICKLELITQRDIEDFTNGS